MPRKTISLLDRNYSYLNMLSAVLDTSVSQIIADILEYIRANVDENDIWDEWDGAFKEFQSALEELEEEDLEEEEEGEEEDLEEEEEGEEEDLEEE